MTPTGGRRGDPAEAAEFAAWLKDQLADRGLTQAGAAWILGTHPKTVEVWCQGRALPSYSQLVSIVRVFGSTPPALVGRGPDEPDETALG